ncbi:V-type proton ATPase 116 kDa subunit a 1-like isoform X2 [Panulirus ornatus]|uniref:V-type proton ATPase 116 kDa subunit a 1-like isoform X2 n=1 Tax=Panulirus ornatus TaxID=150431 RepID=UPI003A88889C
MGSLFRSEEMALCQLFLQSESAYTCVSELGELGLVQFRDLNPDVNAFQRKFVNEVRRCDEMERKLRYLEREIRKDGIPVLDTGENPEAPIPKEMIDLEVKFEKLENELKEVNSNAEALKRNYLELTELKHILKKTQVFFDEREGSLESGGQTSLTQNLLPEDSKGPIQLGFVAGVILRERIPAFERMLWRACRGNVFLRQAEIEDPLEDPTTGEQVYKSVFIIFFQGDHLKMRVKKICEGFRATMYPCPEAPADRREMAMGVKTRLDDLNTVLSQTQDHRHRVLVSAARNIRAWMMKVWKIKSIYHTLNMFNLDVIQNGLIAECWIPVANLEDVQLALRRGTEKSGSLPAILNRMNTPEAPPTFHRTNKFTKAFQTLIDSYGVATYREINPAPYTIITFPFLFAIMFGDLGHGMIMALFGAWMVWREKPLSAKKTDNEIWNIFFGGRYIIFLMGLFSMYTGLVYNDVFSKSINIFGSSWHGNAYNDSTILENKELTLDPGDTKQYDQYPYPFGLDPMWQISNNKINFFNSYKMKISIIFGIVHMLFGVILSVWNHRFFNRPLNIYCEFIPQLIFLTFLFVYLILLVFHKWVWYGAGGDSSVSPNCAPSILITFINMVLVKPYQEKSEGDKCSPYMFAGQFGIQRFLLIVALFCVPWMLCAKPFFLHRANKRRQLVMQANGGEGVIEEGGAEAAAAAVGTEEQHDMSEVMIHQGIHTIEYVLGSVSHTASYLRLWALSLAHAQLSEVLWGMVLRIGLIAGGKGGGIVMYLIFAIWASLTVAILVLMEGLSAFLHTLRLHWVEFQSKFYGGTGYAFVPFAFETILDQAENTVVEQ